MAAMAANPNIFGAGVRERSRWITAQRRVNALYELAGAGGQADRGQVNILARPGLTLHANLGETPIRGMHAAGPDKFAAHRNKLYRVRNDGTSVELGTLDTSEGMVYFTHGHLNSAGKQHLMLVDGVSGYTWDLVAQATFAKISDADFPAKPEACTYINGRFIVNRGGTGQWFMSALDDATNWNALDFETAAQGPDNLLRPFAYQGVLGLFGENTSEFWGYTGDAAFPFARLYATAMDWGLAARGSMAPFGAQAAALMRNTLGEAMPALVTAAGITQIGPPDLVAAINSYVQTADAVGASFMVNGHALYLLTFPNATAAGTARSWVYDAQSGVWSEWETGAAGGAFAGMHAVAAADRIFIGGRADGRLFVLDDAAHTDAGAVLPLELVSQHLFAPGNAKQICRALQLDIETGVGLLTGQGSAPEAMLSVSRDGGRSFGPARVAGFGAQGAYRTRCRWSALGAARDFVFQLRITDPVKRVITGEAVEMMAGAA
jgi:hypothetical protein